MSSIPFVSGFDSAAIGRDLQRRFSSVFSKRQLPGRNRTVSKRANEIRAVRLAPGEAYSQSYSKSVGLTPDGTEMESVAHQQGFVRKLSVLERPLLAQSGPSQSMIE